MTTIANHSRRQLAVLTLAAGALALGFSAASIAQSARPAEIKLGIALSLTGNNAESGRDSKRGIELQVFARRHHLHLPPARASDLQMPAGGPSRRSP